MSRFDFKECNQQQRELINEIRKRCEELDELIQVKVASSREKSLAQTKLEEVAMWSNKAISHNGVLEDLHLNGCG